MYRYVVPVLSKEHLVITDGRSGIEFEIPLAKFQVEPGTSEYRERHLVAEHLGYRVSIPIVMEFNRDGHIEGAKDDLEAAIRILETENPLKSKTVVDGRLVEDKEED